MLAFPVHSQVGLQDIDAYVGLSVSSKEQTKLTATTFEGDAVKRNVDIQVSRLHTGAPRAPSTARRQAFLGVSVIREATLTK